MTSTMMPREDVSLSAVRAGEVVLLESIHGGHHFMSRLASLGFTPGARLTVVQNFGHGPIIVRLRDSRVALGRGEAGKISVRHLPAESVAGGDAHGH
jgi:Fe2+ transport system protein FeoA